MNRDINPKIDNIAKGIWRERVKAYVYVWKKVEKAKTIGKNNIFCKIIP